MTDRTLYDRIFEDKRKPSFYDSAKEYLDITDPSHPWSKIERTLNRWAGRGDDDAAPAKPEARHHTGDEGPKKVKLPTLKKPTASLDKLEPGIKALERLKERTKRVARERWRPSEGSRGRRIRVAGQAGYSAPPRNVTGPTTSRNVGRRNPNPPTTR